jgi:hypothetical protein
MKPSFSGPPSKLFTERNVKRVRFDVSTGTKVLTRSTYSLWPVLGAEYAFNIDPSIPSDTMLQRRSAYCGENSETGGNRKELDLVSGIREQNKYEAAVLN